METCRGFLQNSYIIRNGIRYFSSVMEIFEEFWRNLGVFNSFGLVKPCVVDDPKRQYDLNKNGSIDMNGNLGFSVTHMNLQGSFLANITHFTSRIARLVILS